MVGAAGVGAAGPVATLLNPAVTVFVMSSFLCGRSDKAYATSFHWRSVSHRGRRAASLSAN